MKIGYMIQEKNLCIEDHKRCTGLPHVEEIITIDQLISQSCIRSYEESDYPYIFRDGSFSDYDIFTNLDYMLEKIEEKTNKQILALIREPDVDCRFYKIDGFEFCGYDLIEDDSRRSYIHNFQGKYKSLLSKKDITKYGLISDYLRCMEIKKEINDSNQNNGCKIWSVYRKL